MKLATKIVNVQKMLTGERFKKLRWQVRVHFTLLDTREIWFWLQKRFRGYGDDDLWGLDWWMTKKIRKPFKHFVANQKKYGHGCPSQLTMDKEGKNTMTVEEGMKEWNRILAKIDKAFDIEYEENMWTDSYSKKTTGQRIEDSKKRQEGMELFGKYYGSFWD